MYDKTTQHYVLYNKGSQPSLRISYYSCMIWIDTLIHFRQKSRLSIHGSSLARLGVMFSYLLSKQAKESIQIMKLYIRRCKNHFRQCY